MAGQNPGSANLDQFDAYFRRADLDGDGRISGAEAVSFFEGSNLPKTVLAQIWVHADQAKTGFLGRPEFYNALRLATVAQSKRELTPDIVRAALYGPAAAKIPAPKINSPISPVPQPNLMAAPPSTPQMRTTAPVGSQQFGFRAQGIPNAVMNQQYYSSQPNQTMTPQLMSSGVASQVPQSFGPSEPRGGNFIRPNVPNSNISNNWLGGRTGGAPTGPQGVTPLVPSQQPAAASQAPMLTNSLVASNNSNSFASGNGFAADSAFGGDLFSATPSPAKPGASVMNYAISSGVASSAVGPGSGGNQSLSRPSSLDSLTSALPKQPSGVNQPLSGPSSLDSLSSALPKQSSGSQFQSVQQSSGGQFQSVQVSMNPISVVSSPGTPPLASAGMTTGSGNSTIDNWPKMKPSDVQKYTKVFMEVDTDRDGIITGEQARNLFLSWRLPREVLKQVWDLSDEDGDSMLSLREFCFALYFMERFREGQPLPAELPPSVMFDQSLMSMTGQPKVAYGNVSWSTHPGFGNQQGLVGSQLVRPSTGLRPPTHMSVPKADGATKSNNQKSVAPVLEDSFINDRHNEQQSASSKTQETEKKVVAAENVYLDSKEKIEFYRTTMQELVLYKSRCDNRLNEITARASADKLEAESLGKKYEEKYKQVAEVASKLTIEEAKFRDIQERKVELNQAIIKMEQGGSADGILQVRSDRIQSDLEDLMKALIDRCKKHGLEIKPAALIELPIGWQPGISEEASVWDEDWDKFEDEGFANDLNLTTKNSSSPKRKSTAVFSEKDYSDSSSNANGKIGNSLSTVENGLESESVNSHSEDELPRSPSESPAGRTTPRSEEFSDAHHRGSETDAETHRSFDETNWGTFDGNDDVDSIWGFSRGNGKESVSESNRDFFGSSDFRVNSIKTGSPEGDSIFPRKNPIFEDSVPSTPLSRFGNSSPRYGDEFNNFPSFDSFSMHDGGFSPRGEKLTRFDSINSSVGFGKFSRFDSIGSSRDMGQNSQMFTRFDSTSSSRDMGQNSQMLTRFDSISSTRDFGHSGAFSSFDDADPFGSSGPFKVSSDSQTPKKGADNWKAF